MIDLILFYNISGTLLCILSFIMLTLPEESSDKNKAFNMSKRCMAFLILLAGMSMFLAQFEKRLPEEQFEKLNACMLLFFFLIGQGTLFSILTLYASPYASRKYLQRILFPVLPWFGLYILIYFFTGDVSVYSFDEFFSRLPHEPLLMLRCIILVSMTVSIIYSIRLCHRAKREYHRLILCYFSETDFSHSVWLANLLGGAEALSVWVTLTYFYTNPVLEIIVGTLIIIMSAFYVKEFYSYDKRYGQLRPAILLSGRNNAVTMTSFDRFSEYEELDVTAFTSTSEPEHMKYPSEDLLCASLLDAWVERADKPFARPGLTIGDVAADIGVPKYRLSNHINYGRKNFNTWVRVLRIEEASRLLIECPSLSASEIAERTGFCDLPAFSRAFKKVKEITPREYRNKEYSKKK